MLSEGKRYIKLSGGEKWTRARAVARDVYLSHRMCTYKPETRILTLSVTESWELYQKCTFVHQGWRAGFALSARKCESKHRANVDSRTPVTVSTPSVFNPEPPTHTCLLISLLSPTVSRAYIYIYMQTYLLERLKLKYVS